MDGILTAKMIEALSEGDTRKLVGYLAIFLVLWLEVRGMKKQLKTLNETISNSFAAGEKRFETIERNVTALDHRLAAVEMLKTQGG